MANDHHGSDCMNLQTGLVSLQRHQLPASRRTNHSKMKAWAWHKSEFSPFCNPSYPIIEATLAPALAMDARRRNRLGVVLSFLNTQNDSTVRVMATIEQPAPVRSIVMRTSISSGERAWPGPGPFIFHFGRSGIGELWEQVMLVMLKR